MLLVLLSIFLTVTALNLSSATLGYDNPSLPKLLGRTITETESTTNYSIVNVNRSQYWDDLDDPTDLYSTFDGRYLEQAGDTVDDNAWLHFGSPTTPAKAVFYSTAGGSPTYNLTLGGNTAVFDGIGLTYRATAFGLPTGIVTIGNGVTITQTSTAGSGLIIANDSAGTNYWRLFSNTTNNLTLEKEDGTNVLEIGYPTGDANFKSNVDIDQNLTVGSGYLSKTIAYLASAEVGTWSVSPYYAVFKHISVASPNYALIQLNSGASFVATSVGRYISFSSNAQPRFVINGSLQPYGGGSWISAGDGIVGVGGVVPHTLWYLDRGDGDDLTVIGSGFYGDDVIVDGSISVGNSTQDGLLDGDINASTIYYDSLTPKSPIVFELSNTTILTRVEGGDWIECDYKIKGDCPIDSENKMNKITTQREAYACADSLGDYDSRTGQCNPNEQKICESVDYQYWDNGKCKENLYLKCINTNLKRWDEENLTCVTDETMVCASQEDMFWNAQTNACEFSPELQETRLKDECNQDRSNVWINEGCVSADMISVSAGG